ncbi:hypothetical protein DPSP01_000836 [Paraphaeosphaeria sporulosa]
MHLDSRNRSRDLESMFDDLYQPVYTQRSVSILTRSRCRENVSIPPIGKTSIPTSRAGLFPPNHQREGRRCAQKAHANVTVPIRAKVAYPKPPMNASKAQAA